MICWLSHKESSESDLIVWIIFLTNAGFRLKSTWIRWDSGLFHFNGNCRYYSLAWISRCQYFQFYDPLCQYIWNFLITNHFVSFWLYVMYPYVTCLVFLYIYFSKIVSANQLLITSWQCLLQLDWLIIRLSLIQSSFD